MALFTGFIPSVNQTNVPRTSIVGFTILTDGYGGAQIATLDVNIDGYQAILNGAFVNGYNGNIYPSTGKYVIGVYPKSPFLSSAASISVSLSILDSYSTLDAYDYNFYTAGYGAVPVTDPIVIVPGGICDQTKPFFLPSDLGLRAALDTGTGTEVELQWKQAYPYNEDNIIYYNIYVSSDRRTVYDRKPDFIADNTSIIIGGLAPGEQHFFAVAAAEFNPILHTLNGLRQVGTNLYLHPDTFINVNTTETNTLIRVDSVEGFPEYGIIYVGTELIYYTSLQEYPPAFITSASGRGYYGSIAETHAVNSEVRLYRGKEDNNTIIAQSEPSFQKPFEPITWELTDGYGPDGYRDGYDGYDAYYSNGIAAIYNVFDGVDGYYRHRQEVRDSLTTDGKNNDQSGAFPRFDYCGTYRTHSPYGFMRTGSCTNTYFGGVQKRNGVPVRVPDIRTHMLQREELLLESTGEPFVLLRKMWTGMRCMCSMHRREHADARCPVCFGSSFVQGFVQVFNPRRPDRRILVRVDPSTDDLNLVDRGGFEPHYEPGAWTLPYPALKDRDVLVRFNPDNTEEFRYEILSVERNRAFFIQTGAQKFRIKRIPKTDIMYQFPIVRDTRPIPGGILTSINSASGIDAHQHSIIMPQGANIITLKVATLEAEGHNHIVYNGIVQSVLGHTHII